MLPIVRLRLVYLCCCAAATFTGGAAASPLANPTPPDDSASVRRLMDEYHSAVVGHDGQRLEELFVPTGNAWFSVLSDDAYAAVRAKSPEALKVRPSTVAGFAKFVSSSKANLDPQHGPVQIRTNGAIASVYFDFQFFIDGKVQNTGSESWQLVKYPDGWRIASIVFSSTPPTR